MPLFRTLLWIATLAGCALAAHAQVQSESRLALLIGNAAYKSSPLKNPVNDVRLMESSLKEAGFTIIKAENATRREMQRMVRDFGERLKQSGGVGLFYFAGHGVQVKGANYLVPVDADIRAEDEVAFDSVDAQSILEKMETAKNRINLLILDACRDNPFAKGSRSGSAGLATMSAPSGSLVAYSTAPGSVASDGSGNNGLYTQHLAAVMRVPDMPIEEVFKRVRANVRKDSANQQTPWENTALEGNFYFKQSPPVVAALAPAPAAQPIQVAPAAPNMMAVELSYWDSIKTSSRPFELEAYIEQFPNGMFASLAKARLREVTRELTAAKKEPQQPAQLVAMVMPPAPVAANAIVKATTTLDMTNLTQGQSIGTLQVVDRMFNNKSEKIVTVVEKKEAYIVFSSGDKITADGKVLAVLFGERVFTLESGKLWQLPLKPGDKGKADVKVNRLDGSLSWQIKAGATNGSYVVHVDYQYLIPGAYGGAARFGTWTGDYASGQVLPMNTKFTFAGGSSRPELVTTTLAQ